MRWYRFIRSVYGRGMFVHGGGKRHKKNIHSGMAIEMSPEVLPHQMSSSSSSGPMTTTTIVRLKTTNQQQKQKCLEFRLWDIIHILVRLLLLLASSSTPCSSPLVHWNRNGTFNPTTAFRLFHKLVSIFLQNISWPGPAFASLWTLYLCVDGGNNEHVTPV